MVKWEYGHKHGDTQWSPKYESALRGSYAYGVNTKLIPKTDKNYSHGVAEVLGVYLFCSAVFCELRMYAAHVHVT